MQLQGEISPALGRLDALTKLSLDGHQLTGEIPRELGQLANLTVLDLGSNKLSGRIPDELRALTNLTRLALYQNELDWRDTSLAGRTLQAGTFESRFELTDRGNSTGTGPVG